MCTIAEFHHALAQQARMGLTLKERDSVNNLDGIAHLDGARTTIDELSVDG